MASYTISHNAADRVTFTVTGLTAGNVVAIMFRPLSTNYLLYHILFRATSSTLTKIFPDTITSNVVSVQSNNSYYDGGMVLIYLSPDTGYTARVRVYEDESATEYTDLGVATWTTPGVTDWDWNISNGSATASQTKAAYEAITNNGYLSDFSYKVWNDMVNKVNNAVTDRSGSWNTTYGTLAETLMTTSDKAMTAKRFNALWWNLGQYVSTGLSSARVKGEVVMGNYFVLMAAAINKAIWRGTITYDPNA